MKPGNSSAFMNLDLGTLLRFGAKYPPVIMEGQWWRVVTAGFLHGGLMHIAMNMWVLMDLGAQVEEVYGTSTVCGHLPAFERGRISAEHLLVAMRLRWERRRRCSD